MSVFQNLMFIWVQKYEILAKFLYNTNSPQALGRPHRNRSTHLLWYQNWSPDTHSGNMKNSHLVWFSYSHGKKFPVRNGTLKVLTSVSFASFYLASSQITSTGNIKRKYFSLFHHQIFRKQHIKLNFKNTLQLRMKQWSCWGQLFSSIHLHHFYYACSIKNTLPWAVIQKYEWNETRVLIQVANSDCEKLERKETLAAAKF